LLEKIQKRAVNMVSGLMRANSYKAKLKELGLTALEESGTRWT
jgi:hypothetical protein